MMKVIKSKLNKRIALVLLASGIALGGLTGCSTSETAVKSQKVYKCEYTSTLAPLTGMADTEAQEYVNNIPFKDATFRESIYNTIVNSSYREYTLCHNFNDIVDLELTNVSDYTDLRLFPNMKILKLDNCKLDDYSKFNNTKISILLLKNMTIDCNDLIQSSAPSLIIDDCTLTNQLALKDSLASSMEFDYTKLDNLDFVKNNSGLKTLSLTNNDIPDFSALKDSDITSLKVSCCQIGDFSFLNNMKSLQSLNLSYTNLSDISFLKNMNDLKDLDIGYTFVKDLSPIKDLSLNSLNIESCKEVTNYSVLKDLSISEFHNENMEMDYENDVNSSVKKLYDSIGITDNMSDEQKVRKITIKILDLMKLDLNNTNSLLYYNNNELKSALEGLGLCPSYSGLTTALLDLAGINNYSLQGENVLDNENYLHRWNIVEVDGKWEGLDLTFLDDDTVNGEEALKNGEDSIYYLDDLNSAEWEKYHYPYAMPDIGTEYDYNLAR